MNEPSRNIRILLVDDHFLIRVGLAFSLEGEPDLKVVAQAGTGEEAITAFREHRPDVVLMDGRLPDIHGVEAAQRILAEFPDARIAMISIEETEEDIHRAIKAGLMGYLPKNSDRPLLLEAVRALSAGNVFLPPEIAERLKTRQRREPLNERDLEVLQMVVKGMANKQIADALNVAEITIKVRVSRILAKLGVPDRTRAAMLALERGLVKL